MNSVRNILHVDGVSLTGHGGALILDNIHFALRAGEKLAVIGPNGGGKSSLLRALIGETRPDSGGIHWRGRALSSGRRRNAPKASPFWRKTIRRICGCRLRTTWRWAVYRMAHALRRKTHR